MSITPTRLRELLHYDPDTGVFTWRVSRGGMAQAGSVAGTTHPQGYLRITVDRRLYLAHRLAFFYTHGRWPTNEIDHVNCVRSDNRLINLREATRSENKQNSRCAQMNSKSGLLGVCWDKRRGRWVAKITLDGNTMHLGYFDSSEEAHAAYLEAKARVHTFQTIVE